MGLPAGTASEPASLHGFAGKEGVAGGPPEAMEALLAATKARRGARAATRGKPADRRLRLGHASLRKLAGQAAATGTQLHFLYLQSYGEPWARIWSRDVYEALGDLWIPPAEIFQDPANWWDPNHLNERGARALAAWIATRLSEAR